MTAITLPISNNFQLPNNLGACEDNSVKTNICFHQAHPSLNTSTAGCCYLLQPAFNPKRHHNNTRQPQITCKLNASYPPRARLLAPSGMFQCLPIYETPLHHHHHQPTVPSDSDINNKPPTQQPLSRPRNDRRCPDRRNPRFPDGRPSLRGARAPSQARLSALRHRRAQRGRHLTIPTCQQHQQTTPFSSVSRYLFILLGLFRLSGLSLNH